MDAPGLFALVLFAEGVVAGRESWLAAGVLGSVTGWAFKLETRDFAACREAGDSINFATPFANMDLTARYAAAAVNSGDENILIVVARNITANRITPAVTSHCLT